MPTFKTADDFTAVEERPLLACYFPTCASDSDLLHFRAMEIGTQGFVQKVESLEKKIGRARATPRRARSTPRASCCTAAAWR